MFCVKKFVPHKEVVVQGMVVGLIITNVIFSRAPKYFKLALGFAVVERVKEHIYDFYFYCFSVPSEKSYIGVLSIWSLVGGCGCPILMRQVLTGT